MPSAPQKMKRSSIVKRVFIAAAAFGLFATFFTGFLPENEAVCDSAVEAGKSLAEKAKEKGWRLMPANRPQLPGRLFFKEPDGKEITLTHFHGKTILLNLWATWCKPCKDEMPALDKLQKALQEKKNFEIIAVNIDTGDKESGKKFLESINAHALRYYYENTLSLFETLKKEGIVAGLPSSLIIDQNGCMLASLNGPAQWSDETARYLMEEAIAYSEKTPKQSAH